MITMRKQLLSAASLSLLLVGCGGGGGGSAGVGNGGQQSFVNAVQQAASASSDEVEPMELNIDAGGDSGADEEPLTL
jgi:hypothetical protein